MVTTQWLISSLVSLSGHQEIISSDLNIWTSGFEASLISAVVTLGSEDATEGQLWSRLVHLLDWLGIWSRHLLSPEDETSQPFIQQVKGFTYPVKYLGIYWRDWHKLSWSPEDESHRWMTRQWSPGHRHADGKTHKKDCKWWQAESKRARDAGSVFWKQSCSTDLNLRDVPVCSWNMKS